jgi:hypothetical protein
VSNEDDFWQAIKDANSYLEMMGSTPDITWAARLKDAAERIYKCQLRADEAKAVEVAMAESQPATDAELLGSAP